MNAREVCQGWAIDLRSLAAFRAGLAVVLLFDVAQRAVGWRALYSEGGILPSGDWYALDWRHWPLAPFVLEGGDPAVIGTMVVAACAAVALLVGWHSRVAAAVAWLAIVALQARNPLVNFGGDAVLRLALLLATFMPIGAVWSVDARTDGGAAARLYGSPLVLALRAQMAIVLFVAGWAKLQNEAWRVGLGVLHAWDHEFVATGLAQDLHSWVWLGSTLNYLTILVELGAACLVLLPLRTPRLWLVTFVALLGMFAGFSLTLRVGIFPVVTLVALLPFLPGAVWDRSLAEEPRARVRFGPEGGSRRLAATFFAVLFVTYIVVWNIGLWRDAGYRPPAILAEFGQWLNLEQRWGMFTRIPATGWLVVPGRLRDGRTLDLLRNGGPLPELSATDSSELVERRPANVATSFRDIRWRALMMAMTESAEQRDRIAMAYGRYLCREWNRRQQGSEQLETLEIVFHHRPLRPRATEPVAYYRTVLWTHWCFR